MKPAQGTGQANYAQVEFPNHAVVTVEGITKPNAIYDPSYGGSPVFGDTMPLAELTWENRSIESYAYLRQSPGQNPAWSAWVPDEKDVDELNFN